MQTAPDVPPVPLMLFAQAFLTTGTPERWTTYITSRR
jgi:hypothetical protein